MMCKCLSEKDFWINAFYENNTDIEPKNYTGVLLQN